MIFLISLILSISSVAPSEKQPDPKLVPGTWGGILENGKQETNFYLTFEQNDKLELIAYLSLPITNFHMLPLGNVKCDGSKCDAGSLQFSMNPENEIVGSFKGIRSNLTFRLLPQTSHPERKLPPNNDTEVDPVWTFKTGGPIWGDSTTDGSNIFIGSADGTLYSLKAEDGSLNWKFNTNGPIFSKPVIHNDMIMVLSDDGYLYNIDIKKSELIWKRKITNSDWSRSLPDHEKPGYETKSSAPVIVDGIIYIGSPDGHIYALDQKSGNEFWRYKTGAPVLSIPAVQDGLLISGSMDHHVYGIDLKSGTLIWKHNTGQQVISNPVLYNDFVVIGSRSADLLILNKFTGDKVWSYFYWFSWVESSASIYNDSFYIGSSDLQLIKAFNPLDGSLLWSADVGGSPWATPAVTDSTIYSGVFGNSSYIIDHRGGFVALDRNDGHIKWRFNMSKQSGTPIYGVVSSAVIAEEIVAFGGLNGIVYGFNLKGN